MQGGLALRPGGAGQSSRTMDLSGIIKAAGLPVVLAQQGQEALPQHDRAVLLALPRPDMKASPLAVNVGEAQSAYLGISSDRPGPRWL